MLINRRQSKLIQLGLTSLVTVVPWEIVTALNLRKGDPMVTYQLDGLMVLTPLAYLGEIGQPKLVKYLEAFPQNPLP